MATEVKTHRDHPSSMSERISKRLNTSSSPAKVSTQVTHGSGPTRTVHTVHNSGGAGQHGPAKGGEEH
jgi:hypothetical protein